MDNSNNQNQYRFLIAAALSMAVLFGWSYLFPGKKPVDNANSNTQIAANTAVNSPAPVAATPAAAPVQNGQQQTPAAAAEDTTPGRTITIKSPLYEVKLDSKGALATSWILLKNEGPKGHFPVYADGSNSSVEKPLQLISAEGLAATPRLVPFRLETGDPALDTVINDRNFQVSVPNDDITLAAGQQQQIDFTLTDAIRR